MLVDDGLGWASFPSKYQPPGPAGLMQTSLPPIHLPRKCLALRDCFVHSLRRAVAFDLSDGPIDVDVVA